MAKTKKPKAYRKKGKRGYRKKKTASALAVTTAIPDKKTIVFRYCEHIRLDTAGSGLPASYVFRGNSCFAPNFSASLPFLTHQPMFWDQVGGGLYQHYRVYKSKIVVKAVSYSNTRAAILTVHADRQSLTSQNILASLERPRSKYRLIESGGGSVRIENMAWTTQMLPNVPSDLTAQFNQNPADQWFWHLSTIGVADTDAVLDVTVELYYFTQMSERKIQNLS